MKVFKSKAGVNERSARLTWPPRTAFSVSARKAKIGVHAFANAFRIEHANPVRGQPQIKLHDPGDRRSALRRNRASANSSLEFT